MATVKRILLIKTICQLIGLLFFMKNYSIQLDVSSWNVVECHMSNLTWSSSKMTSASICMDSQSLFIQSLTPSGVIIIWAIRQRHWCFHSTVALVQVLSNLKKMFSPSFYAQSIYYFGLWYRKKFRNQTNNRKSVCTGNRQQICHVFRWLTRFPP